jgi:hypothetical protein
MNLRTPGSHYESPGVHWYGVMFTDMGSHFSCIWLLSALHPYTDGTLPIRAHDMPAAGWIPRVCKYPELVSHSVSHFHHTINNH